MKVKSLSRVRPSVTPWTAAYQAPPSMGLSRQEHWSGVPLPSLLTAMDAKWIHIHALFQMLEYDIPTVAFFLTPKGFMILVVDSCCCCLVVKLCLTLL